MEGSGRITSHICPVSCEQVQDEETCPQGNAPCPYPPPKTFIGTALGRGGFRTASPPCASHPPFFGWLQRAISHFVNNSRVFYTRRSLTRSKASTCGLESQSQPSAHSTGGAYRSRCGCVTLPALIQRHAAGVPGGVPTRCSTPTACCRLCVPLPRRRSARGSSLLRSTHRWDEAPMMSSAHALCSASHPLVKEGPL